MTREEALIQLALYCLSDAGWAQGGWNIGDIDGGAFQDECVRLGLLVHRKHNEDEGSDCDCEYVDGVCDGGEACGALFLTDGICEMIAKADASRREGGVK